ncbi:MAG: amidohydrolase family protein [Halobacteriales archaeon]
MIDCHFHVRADDHSTPEKRAEYADWVRSETEALGIETVCGMMGFAAFADSVAEARRKNGHMAKYVEEYPDLFHGWARINPAWGEPGVEEFRRAVEEDGLMGLKLYADVYVDDPQLDPYAEAAVDMDVPIIHHVSGRRDHVERPETPSFITEESRTEHVARRAERSPDLDLIAAHIGGGGDWEHRIKNLVAHDSVYLDISGTNCDAGMVEMAVESLGADRCVFGTDNWLLPCVGKLRGADVTDDQRETIAYRMRDIIEGTA